MGFRGLRGGIGSAAGAGWVQPGADGAHRYCGIFRKFLQAKVSKPPTR